MLSPELLRNLAKQYEDHDTGMFAVINMLADSRECQTESEYSRAVAKQYQSIVMPRMKRNA